jgi:hypothetical protein
MLLGWLVLVGRGVGRVMVMVTVMVCLRSRLFWEGRVQILLVARIDYRLSDGIGLIYRRGIGFGSCFMLTGIIFGALVFVFLGETQLDRGYLSGLDTGAGCFALFTIDIPWIPRSIHHQTLFLYEKPRSFNLISFIPSLDCSLKAIAGRSKNPVRTAV